MSNRAQGITIHIYGYLDMRACAVKKSDLGDLGWTHYLAELHQCIVSSEAR
jgi:hypothetical protein